MNETIKGKKLLILGGKPAGTPDIVRIAKRLGIHTIVTDNLAPENSPAKLIADEVWDISTADVGTLAQKAREHGVSGVFFGAHEFNLMRAKEIAALCGFPFYATDEQLLLNFNKEHFKAKCREFGISVPRSYDPADRESISSIEYPVIVKPLDGNGGRGITICHEATQIDAAIDFAYEYSPGKKAVIEEYVVGREITAVYTIKDGEVSLSCFRDRYPTEEMDQVTAQYDLSLIPSQYTKLFLDTAHERFVRLLSSVNAQNGCVFFQGIANRNKITFFECGYRPNALCDYHNIAQLNGINYLEMMIVYALTGRMDPYELSMDDPLPDSFSGIFNLTAHAGVITRQEGVEAVRELEHVIAADYLHVIGDRIADNTALAQSVFRAHIFGSTREELENTIHRIQELVVIEDEQGRNMLFRPFDSRRLFKEEQ